ncbi:MAG: SUMF1/EgtB/PvdO family nonheme iron enzyme [Verrucomicrobiales bacterium]|nr:SUMF1/EgtB/PvdO family nonheme iron enzyme [Verrucomicrobiales bacterium]
MPPSCRRLLFLSVAPVFLLVNPVGVASQESQRNSLGIELQLLEGGRFARGTDGGERALEQAFPLSVNAQFFGNPEAPKHLTWITKPFWIAKTEVTVGQWKAFVEATGYATTAEESGRGIVGWSPTPEDAPLYQSHDFERKPEFTWRTPGFPQEDSHPVVGVSWSDTQAFLKWLSEKEGVRYRLPTEAEWEFACRAGTESWFYFGDQPRGVVHRHANLANVELEEFRPHSTERQWLLDWEREPADGNVFTAPVGSYEANPFGLHDLHGNVWEWCQDLWLDTFYKRYDWPKRNDPRITAVDPVNDSEPQTEANRFRSIRGGSWYNGPVICRSANRVGWDEPDGAAYIGFRVVREADPAVSTTARDSLAKEEAAKKAAIEAGGTFSSSGGVEVELRLEGETFPFAVLPLLGAISELDGLSLAPKSNYSLTSEDVAALASLTNLRSIDFRASFDFSEVDLSPLASLPRLEILRFSRSSSLNDGNLGQLSGTKTLKEFVCYGASGGLTDKGIAHLGGNAGLTRLQLFEVDASGEFLKGFSKFPLEEFSLTARAGADVQLLDRNAALLGGFSNLSHLALNQQGLLTDSTLLTVGTLAGLTELNLHGCSGLSPSGFAPIGKLHRLRSLNLQGTAAGDEAVAALSGVPRIEILRIGSPNLTDRGLAELSKLFSVQNLYIETCLGTDEGVQHLGRINRLKQLDLGAPAMTGSSLGALAKLPELNDLRLRSPALTNVIFELFATARSLRKLRLTERGWQPPSALTNEGLFAIAPATWLTELWLPRNDTGLTEEGFEELKILMPKTNVISYTVAWDRPEVAP